MPLVLLVAVVTIAVAREAPARPAPARPAPARIALPRPALARIAPALEAQALSFSQAAAPPLPPATAGAPAPAAPAPAPAAPATEPYTYNPDGRRDPFTSLLGTGGIEVRTPTGSRADGPAAIAVSDVSVRGILQSRGVLVAMIQGPDNKTYIVHQGERLLDGTIKSITPQGLVILQQVNDPLSLVKQREVSKLLRSLEAVK